ncbi:hypothetical protein QUC31_018890 [Theobroma cacao]
MVGPCCSNLVNGENSHQVVRVMEAADMDETSHQVIRTMEAKINQPPKLLNKYAGNKSCCIFRVPESLVQINEKAYQPHIISIGPYHHGKEHLKMMQEHKWRFLGSLLHRIRRHNVGLFNLFQAIKQMEDSIRECYSETIGMDSHVLGSGQEHIPSLARLTLGFFNYMAQRPIEVLEKHNNLTGRHLLDLFRMSFLPPSSEEASRNSNSSEEVSRNSTSIEETSRKSSSTEETSTFLQLIPSARKLHLAGIQFKLGKGDSFLDVRFSNGVLQIPLLTIDDFTSSVFLNCVAFEQCYNHRSNHITTYATFMGCLINTPSDAGFLRDHKIIENYFGTDEEIARFFNNVGKDVAFDIEKSYLSKLFQDVNEYYRNDWHVRWAGFKHTYFDTPWSFMSALAALILLIFTMIQAFFAIYAYIRPLKNPK